MRKNRGFTPVAERHGNQIMDERRDVNGVRYGVSPREHPQGTKPRAFARGGFTIIELLVALTIVAILASLAVASYTAARQNSRNAKRRGDMVALQQAFEQYYLSNQTYATPCSTMATGYLQGTFPTETYVGWTAYSLRCSATSYCVCARLEGGTGGNAINNTTDPCSFGVGEYFCIQNQQ